MRRIRNAAGAFGLLASLLVPMSQAAGFEPLAVYEDWLDGVVDSGWWLGGEVTGGQELEREVVEAAPGVRMLRVRYRHEGSTTSDSGTRSVSHFLRPPDHEAVTAVEAIYNVQSLDITACAGNNAGAVTRARPAQLVMEKFNDGSSSGPGDRTGDLQAGVQAVRNGSSTAPPGMLSVEAFIIRCSDASCGTFSSVDSEVLGTVAVGQTFRIRVQWDPANHQFLTGLDDAPDVTLTYTASDTTPAGLSFVNIANINHNVANCTAGPASIDSTTFMGSVLTNVSGLVTRFADVTRSHLFFRFIEALAAAGITGGCSLDPPGYCPEATVTRGQMAVFLLRGINGAGATPPAATGTVFGDVPVSHLFAAWIEQLAAVGITSGCAVSPPAYCPEATVTRGQMAVFLLRAKHGAGYLPPDATGVFADVPTDHLFARWIEQLSREGITGGCNTAPPMYCPDAPVTRGQMAVFLVRTFNLPM
jgi:hypothetical protein